MMKRAKDKKTDDLMLLANNRKQIKKLGGETLNSLQDQVNSLQVKIVAEDKTVEGRTQDYLAESEMGKPVEGALRPDEALQRPVIFESINPRLNEERDNAGKASEDRMVVGW